MSVLRFVLRSAGRASIAMALIGACGAAFNAGLIACVHAALTGDGTRPELALSFVGLGCGKIAAAYLSGRMTDSYSFESITRLRRELIGKLLRVPYRSFEQLGQARAYSALTSDVSTIHAALQATAGAVVNTAILLGGAAYLLYLDVRAFAGLLALMLLGLCVYAAVSKHARALLRRAREEHDRLFQHFGALTHGIKEFKLNAARRRAFVDGPLLETTEAMMEHDLVGSARYALGQAVNGTLVLVMIGLVLFALPWDASLRSGAASGYVLTGLYLTGPLTGLLRLLPLYTAAEIALSRVEQLGVRLGAEHGERGADPGARPSFRSIALCDVSHRYAEGEPLVLGPLTLRVAPAQIVFVTGGNGSGKSTLAKILTGLYEPTRGALEWDGAPVDAERRDLYRQLFSAVFSEFHVFDRLYGLSGADLDARAARWLEALELAGVVHVRDGALSSVDLSRGQRKRLALLTALLEDRPIYVFDEWAADQDPHFKQVFYRQLLPELRARGKAVVVISHDDRFFDIADRLIELDGGQARERARERSSTPYEA
jgi:putative ATP-binding cassette transporter